MIARYDEYADLKAQRQALAERLHALAVRLELYGTKTSEIMKELEAIRLELYPCLGSLGTFEPETMRDTLIQMEELKP